MQLRVRPETRALIDRLTQDTPATAVGLVSRVLDWFEAQDRAVQREILDAKGDAAGVLVSKRLAELSAAGQGIEVGPGRPLSIDDAARLIHTLTDYIQQVSRGVAAVARESLKGPVAKKKG